ncbi:DNA cytosine methyltransferase [Oceanithermus desulfurans]|uniref:Cytosine-specific methyltransferase n=2 Tax=Oceanithermus desulfurans TaxID=227924 RepID=A0A511RK93_9DEIN|nr:DNA cytosine methyltransferase [Oceanithermus desulfurans]MBB6030520.1 DNA (cytosine-5)-methyltransferase 1 [Oceanithermus desulfurans]GEM90070.1 restriction endonuclease subunit M [Oceanithermus desulfurans NBRC 100063]
MYKAIDLFSGMGGLTLGLKQAGFKVLAAVEKDDLAAETYKANHFEVKLIHDDIRRVNPNKLLKDLGLYPGEIDLVAGCPPCQGFSNIRTLNGARMICDPRNELVEVFAKFILEIQPKAVMMENVTGLVADDRFAVMRKSLLNAGYQETYDILDAQDYGVPQRRRRLIYLAGKGFSIPFGETSPVKLTVREAIANLPTAGKSGDPLHDFPEKRSERIKRLISMIPKNGGSRSDLPEELQLKCHSRTDGFNDVYGRMTWDKVAPTITGGCFNPSKGRFIHPEENRAITIREAALLQGFPADYIFPITKSKVALAEMIGNALPPPFIAAHARSILRVLRDNGGGVTTEKRD